MVIFAVFSAPEIPETETKWPKNRGFSESEKPEIETILARTSLFPN